MQKIIFFWYNRDQPTVTFPIGDHVNVLHDYKNTGPSKIMKLLTCSGHHLVDMLVEFYQNYLFLTLLKWLNVPYPLMLTNFSMNYYAFVLGGEKILPLISYTVNRFYQQTWQRSCSQVLKSDDMTV